LVGELGRVKVAAAHFGRPGGLPADGIDVVRLREGDINLDSEATIRCRRVCCVGSESSPHVQ
jgi:hypothetical protein